MKVTFIQPNMIAGHPGDAMPPLVFGLLSALTPPHIERVLYDEHIEPIPLDQSTDLVAMTADTFSARRAYQIAAAYRRRGVPVVLGGFHASLCPEEAGRYVDVVVVGDAEDTWPQILADAERHSLSPLYQSEFGPLTDTIPDRALFESKKYRAIHLIEYNRGCRFACDFCSIRAMYRSRIRARPLHALVQELDRNRGEHVFFIDDNLYAEDASLNALLDILEPRHVRWSCQVSADVTREPGRVARMARTGCVSVTLGIESLDPLNLAQMGKSWMSGDPAAVIRCFQDHGIMVYGTFVVGYDHDNPDVFDRLRTFVGETRLLLANFNPLTPMPGTALYERLQAEDRLCFNPWWLDPRYRYGDTIFHPAHMTAQQLEAGCFGLRRAFNRTAHIASRFPGSPFLRSSPYKAALFLAANFVSRREIYRKQGQPLGDPSMVPDEVTAPCT